MMTHLVHFWSIAWFGNGYYSVLFSWTSAHVKLCKKLCLGQAGLHMFAQLGLCLRQSLRWWELTVFTGLLPSE